jgi:hypothetical protein
MRKKQGMVMVMLMSMCMTMGRDVVIRREGVISISKQSSESVRVAWGSSLRNTSHHICTLCLVPTNTIRN